MVNYRLFYTKQAIKDTKKLQASKLDKKAKELLHIGGQGLTFDFKNL
jgi:mRNA-degrading endonuclease RelE of RelBE toxin-antitoxin system